MNEKNDKASDDYEDLYTILGTILKEDPRTGRLALIRSPEDYDVYQRTRMSFILGRKVTAAEFNVLYQQVTEDIIVNRSSIDLLDPEDFQS